MNAAAESSSKCKNHAYVMVGPTDFIPHDEDASAALIVTSGHNHEAFSMSPSIVALVATSLLTNQSSSILRQSCPSPFVQQMDIPSR